MRACFWEIGGACVIYETCPGPVLADTIMGPAIEVVIYTADPKLVLWELESSAYAVAYAGFFFGFFIEDRLWGTIYNSNVWLV